MALGNTPSRDLSPVESYHMVALYADVITRLGVTSLTDVERMLILTTYADFRHNWFMSVSFQQRINSLTKFFADFDVVSNLYAPLLMNRAPNLAVVKTFIQERTTLGRTAILIRLVNSYGDEALANVMSTIRRSVLIYDALIFADPEIYKLIVKASHSYPCTYKTKYLVSDKCIDFLDKETGEKVVDVIDNDRFADTWFLANSKSYPAGCKVSKFIRELALEEDDLGILALSAVLRNPADYAHEFITHISHCHFCPKDLTSKL